MLKEINPCEDFSLSGATMWLLPHRDIATVPLFGLMFSHYASTYSLVFRGKSAPS
jgi:hypothetical protein